MATSGSCETNLIDAGDNQYRKLVFTWSLSSQDTINKTSTLTYTLSGGGSGGGWVYMYGCTLIIDGQTVYSSSTTQQLYLTTTVTSGTITLQHTGNGTKNFSVAISAAIYYYSTSATGNGSWDLPTISTTGNFNLFKWSIQPIFPQAIYQVWADVDNGYLCCLNVQVDGTGQCYIVNETVSTAKLIGSFMYPYKVSTAYNSNIVTRIQNQPISLYDTDYFFNGWTDAASSVTYQKITSSGWAKFWINPKLGLAWVRFGDTIVNTA